MKFKMLENGILHKIDLTGLFFTHDGKMWFGTSNGLASYNGNDFTVYPSREGKENIIPQRILTFTEDRHNNLWLFTPSRFLIRFNLLTASYEKVEFSRGFAIPENDIMVMSLYVDNQDKLWIGLLNYGFFIYDLKTGKAEHHNVSEDHQGIWSDKYQNSVRFIKEDPADSNTIWLAAYGVGLIKYNRNTGKTNKNFTASIVKDSVVHNNYITVFDIKDSIIWFGTWGAGIGEYNKRSGRYKMYPKNTGYHSYKIGNVTYTSGHIITGMVKRSDSEYVVALLDSLTAIFNLRNKKFIYLNDDQLSRTIDRVSSIDNDPFGNTWMLKGGKLYISSDRYRLFKKIDIGREAVDRRLASITDVVWNNTTNLFYAATDHASGIYVFDSAFRMKQIISMPLYSGNGFVNATSSWRIRFDGKNHLWVMGFIFCTYDSSKHKMVAVADKYPEVALFKEPLKDFITDKNGNLIIYSKKRQLIFFNVTTRQYSTVDLPELSSEKRIDFNTHELMLDTLRGLVYVCDGRAIYQYNISSNTFRNFEYRSNDTHGLPIQNVSDYTLDFDGNLWVASGGIFIYEPGKLNLIGQISARENLTDNVHIFLFQGPKGYMFIFTPKGGNLYSLKDSTLSHFDMSNGMAHDDPRGIVFARDKIVLQIGHNTNINQYADVNLLLQKPREMVPYISAIRLGAGKLASDTIPEFLSYLKLKYDENNISITFSTTEFEFPERVEYSYELLGLENSWTNTDYLNRSVTYTNLLPGDYFFHIRARMLGGNWTEQSSPLHITIKPAFWQTAVFKVLCILLGIGMVYFLLWQHFNSRRKKERLRDEHEKEMVDLEAKALRAQMNPHFIFNCLNSIKALIQKNETDTAARYLTTFSKLIRTLFEHSDKREVSLYEEIETCKLYTQLEALRFREKVSFIFDVDEKIDLKDVKIPALILQPLIENAIWHGLVPKEKGGTVKVKVLQINSAIKCQVDDDGIGRDLSRVNKAQFGTSYESKGISLTQSRLNLNRILNDKQILVGINDKKDEEGNSLGTTAILTINIQ